MIENRKLTEYQTAKHCLKVCAKAAKEAYEGDKPAIRMCINNYADSLIKEHNWIGTRYEIWLSNLAAKLHP